MRIRKGDQVEVISGKDKGKRGKVLRVISETERAIEGRLPTIARHRSGTGRCR